MMTDKQKANTPNIKLMRTDTLCTNLIFISARTGIRLSKTLFIFIFSVFASIFANAQTDSINNYYTIIEPEENYIILFKFDTVAYVDNCPCYFNKKPKKCKLIKGKVIDVLNCAEGGGHFMTRSEIFATDYILTPSNFHFDKGQNIFVSAFSSADKQYLVYSKTRNRNEYKNYIFRGNIIQSPGDCFRFNLLRRLKITRIPPKEKDIKQDKFTKFLKQG